MGRAWEGLLWWMRATTLSVVMAAGAGACGEARAQTTQLPGITVTTPSPVTPPARGAPAQAPAATPQSTPRIPILPAPVC